ncbi:charged multivesicular body 7 [Brachionus plicatilis]|uniref:Charged multivesicular body 7 n=1 Tax=Brachionus plicatilis TaxID=10195 RepID=A0A3M7S4D9_BRAPC|nr:charged multivesicular body 7 [Brachionus plicatilis]
MQNSFRNFGQTSPYRTTDQLNFTLQNDSVYDIDEDDDIEWLTRPDEWNDDVRMNALFAPFRNRDINPLHYDNKIKFWKQTILSICTEKQIFQFDQKKLENLFTRKGKKPKCLELVINELLSEKSICTREECLKPKTGMLANMLNKLVWSPLSWSASYFFRASNSNGNSSSTFYATSFTPKSPKPNMERSFSCQSPIKELDLKSYVLPDLVEAKSQEILKKLQSTVIYRNVDCILEYDRLLELLAELVDEQDLAFILKYLEINQKILIVASKELDRTLVKFCFGKNDRVAPLNQIEESYIKLKDAQNKLELESGKLSSQIDGLNRDIRDQMKAGNKSSALKVLKKRKQLEKSLDSKENILHNIETMMMSIQQADTNKTTVDVLTKGASALKEANRGINIDQIDDTICEIQDIYNQNNEIEETLARSPMNGKSVFDDRELNDELNQLLSQENDRVDSTFNMDDLLNNLPSIPNDTPRKTGLEASSSLVF